MSTQIMQTKFETEELTLEFDFLSRMTAGETVTTAAVSSTVWSGVDPVSNLVSGIASVSNNVVSQLITGGLPGVIYKITCSVRTSNNNILINEAKLAVLSDDAITPP